MSNQNIVSYPISSVEVTMYTGPYQTNSNNVVTTIVYGLGNTLYKAIVQFYDVPYENIPRNSRHGRNYNVGFPLSALGGFLAMVEKKSVVFNYDNYNNHATFKIAL